MEKNTEAIEAERPAMSTPVPQQSTLLPLSTDKKLPSSKSIIAVTPNSEKYPIKSVIDNTHIYK